MTILRTIVADDYVTPPKGKAGQLAAIDLPSGLKGLILFDGVSEGGNLFVPFGDESIGGGTSSGGGASMYVQYIHKPAMGYGDGSAFNTDGGHNSGARMFTFNPQTYGPYPTSQFATTYTSASYPNGALNFITPGQFRIQMTTTLLLPTATRGQTLSYGTRPTWVDKSSGTDTGIVPSPMSSAHTRWATPTENADLATSGYSGSLVQQAPTTLQWTDEYFVTIDNSSPIMLPAVAVFCPATSVNVTEMTCGVTITQF